MLALATSVIIILTPDTGAENVQERSTSTAEMLGPRDDPVVNRIVCVNRYRRLP